MLDPEGQAEVLRQVAAAAATRGLRVAPVGSIYFLSRGQPSPRTKDLDVVLHGASDDAAVPLAELEALGKDLGTIEVGLDKATVTVTMPGPAGGDINVDLLRGKEGAKRGFFPRSLLAEAARRGTAEGNILWYPVEYVIALKADAAVDREQRAAKGGEFAEANKARAAGFRQDVIRQVQAAMQTTGLREEYFRDAVGHLKESRRAEVARLVEFAAGGRVRVTSR